MAEYGDNGSLKRNGLNGNGLPDELQRIQRCLDNCGEFSVETFDGVVLCGYGTQLPCKFQDPIEGSTGIVYQCLYVAQGNGDVTPDKSEGIDSVVEHQLLD